MQQDLSRYNQEGYSRGKNGFIILLWWMIQGTIFRFSIHNMYSFRNYLLRLFGANIGRGVKIRSTAKFTYPWKVKIGDNSWVGDDVSFYSLDKIIIGENCVISQKSYLCTGSHDINSERFDLITRPIIIKNGVWIAADVFIYPGVIVYENSVVAARSTVLKSVPVNKIYSGNPAKYIKDRYEV